jgi:hypothetical protein
MHTLLRKPANMMSALVDVAHKKPFSCISDVGFGRWRIGSRRCSTGTSTLGQI